MIPDRFSVNSYTFHELLGVNRRPSLGAGGVIVEQVEQSPATLDLLELPAALSRCGIGAVDLCFNHLPSVDDEYLERLRDALASAGVSLFCLLVDFGTLTLPDGVQRDAERVYVTKWIRIAGALGASCVRIQAGSMLPGQCNDTVFERVLDGYRRYADVAEEAGLRLLTENFGSYLLDVDRLLRLLDAMDGRLGLVVDFGNGRQPGEYENLKRLLPRAESIHAKPALDAAGNLMADDFRTCVRLAEEAGFSAPYTLVYRGPLDPFGGLVLARDLVLAELSKRQKAG